MRPDGVAAAVAVRALVDEWARAGVTDAVVAPGSRSTPLALALAGEHRIRVHVLLDERSAAGFALGLGHGTGRPAVLCCTSGTAGAHFHGGVLEAHHGRVPLVVCTADRPPELHDVGAGQTIDQQRLFGDVLRWSHDPGVPTDHPDLGPSWRHLGARSVAAALGPPAGPVHLNLPFREPLVPPPDEPVDEPEGARADGRPRVRTSVGRRAPTDEDVAVCVDAAQRAPRGAVAAGWGSEVAPSTVEAFLAATGWVLLADPLSNLRRPLGKRSTVVSTYDAVLRDPDHARALTPEVVVRLGAPLTGAPARGVLDRAPESWLLDPDDVWLDPARAATVRFCCDPDVLLRRVAECLGDAPPPTAWARRWAEVEAAARRALDEHCDAEPELFEGRIARDVVASAPPDSVVFVASSMPVRDVEGFVAPRDGVRFVANRGTNGIDGSVSTALGLAATTEGPTVALLGDLCLLHDSNGLLGAPSRGLDATLVVVDNDGGGIFSFLPQASHPGVSSADFERLFGTPHGIDLADLVGAYGVPCAVVTDPAEVGPVVRDCATAGGVRVVLVRTDRAANVGHHRGAWDAVRTAVAPLLATA